MRISFAEVVKPIRIKGPAFLLKGASASEPFDSTMAGGADFTVAGFACVSGGFCFGDPVFAVFDEDLGVLTGARWFPQAVENAKKSIKKIAAWILNALGLDVCNGAKALLSPLLY
jgi:hypothetical protein